VITGRDEGRAVGVVFGDRGVVAEEPAGTGGLVGAADPEADDEPPAGDDVHGRRDLAKDGGLAELVAGDQGPVNGRK